MNNTRDRQFEALVGHRVNKIGPFHVLCRSILEKYDLTRTFGGAEGYDRDEFEAVMARPEVLKLKSGLFVEKAAALLKIVIAEFTLWKEERMEEEKLNGMLASTNAQVEASKKTLETLTNDCSALFDQLAPRLIDEVKRLREHRMAVVREVQESLGALRELRKFFLEADYEKEVKRLEQFVALCREIQELKRTGVLDAVADTMVNLMLGESQKKGGNP